MNERMTLNELGIRIFNGESSEEGTFYEDTMEFVRRVLEGESIHEDQ